MALAASNSRMFFPSPNLGINGRDALFEMNPLYCLDQVNIYPDYDKSRLRNSYVELGRKSGLGTMRRIFSVTSAAGVTTFLIIRNGGNVESITSAGAFTSIASILSVNINFTAFSNRIFGAGGGSGPVDFDGTTLNSTAWTGTGLTITNLESPFSYRNKLYFLEANTANLWYTQEFNAITGALLKTPLAANFKFGGYPLFGGSFSDSSGNVDAYCIVVSNFGEVLVFEGDDPGASNWRQVGRYSISSPISRSGFFYYGKDLYLLTTQGIIAMSDIVADNKEGAQYVSVSRNIDPLIASYFAVIQANPSAYVNYAHCAISSTENLLYLPILRLANYGTSSAPGFYVMNLAKKSWGWYSLPVVSGFGDYQLIGVVSDSSKVYFLLSDGAGTMALWRTGETGVLDVGPSTSEPIAWSITSAFAGGKDGTNKKLNKIRPLVENVVSLTPGMFGDFDTTLQASGAVALSSSLNKKYYDFNKEAAFVSLRIAGSSSGSYGRPLYNGTLMTYEPASNPP